MRLEINHVTPNSVVPIPIRIQVKQAHISQLMKHQVSDKLERNKWCLHGKPCAKYGQRPCCPPQTMLFSDLAKSYPHIYVVSAEVDLESYYTAFPKVRTFKAWMYYGMVGSHRITCNISNKIVSHFPGQAFRVGGCRGCQFAKTSKCKRYMPTLEGSGINVCALATELFGIEVTWATKEKIMDTMVAIGAICSKTPIKPSEFKEVINNVFTR